MSTSLPAQAAPRQGSVQTDYRTVQAQVDRIDQQLDVVVEEYNASLLTLNKTQSEIKSYSAKLATIEKEAATRRTAMNKRVASFYRKDAISYLDLLLNTKNLDQFLYCLGLIERLAERDAKIIGELKESNKKIAAQKAILVEKEKGQKAIVAQIKVKKDRISGQLKERNRLLARIGSEIARQKREDAKRQAQLRKKLKLSLKVSYRTRGRGRVSVSRGSGRSSVVGLAMNELGKPYTWGGTGPSSFDCSGFTRYVYGKLGVSLPHSSRAQYGSGSHVSRDELQAGDLVFFARGGTISHVGLYVGGGSFIHAPRTGDVVKISSLGSHGGYVGAVRP